MLGGPGSTLFSLQLSCTTLPAQPLPCSQPWSREAAEPRLRLCPLVWASILALCLIKTPRLAVQGAWGQAGAQKVQRSVGPSYPSLQLDTSYQDSLASCLSVVSALPSPAHHTPLGARDRALSPQVSSIPQLGCHLRPGGALSSVGQCPGRPHHHGALFTPVKRRTVAGSVCAGAREAAWVPA